MQGIVKQSVIRILKAASVAAGADRGPLKIQRKSALRLLVQIPDLRVFDSQQIRPLRRKDSDKGGIKVESGEAVASDAALALL